MLNVLIVDGSGLYRETLSDVLACQPEIGSVATAPDLRSALAHLATSSRDIILLNTAMKDGRAVVRAIRTAATQVPIIEVVRTAAAGNGRRAADLLREHLTGVGCDPLAFRIVAQARQPVGMDDDFEDLAAELPDCHPTRWPSSP
jgi:chemotaxis response regulator CheB